MNTFPLTDGTLLPVLGLGTWEMGGGTRADYSRDPEMVQTIQSLIEMGYIHIDTAEFYGKNHCEELVGAIKAFDRDKLFITTKVWASNLRYDDLLNALDGSLERLDTGYVDLYLIHWPNNDIPLAETFRALNQAVDDGLVRHVGVSNFEVELLKESVDLCDTPLATNQVRYNLLRREPAENGVLAYCQANSISLTAYSPLKDGVLRNSVVNDIATEHGVSPAQVAIGWLLAQPNVITISKTSNLDHARDNLAALSLELSQADITRLDNIV